MSRPDIVKRLWKYIKDNDLQDPADRRFILCDDKLKTIFEQDRINSFGMNRDLSRHLTKKPEGEIPADGGGGDSTTTSTTGGVGSSSGTTGDNNAGATATSTTTTTTGSTNDNSTTGNTTTTATGSSLPSGVGLDTSPAVTAETPDVVTPKEGEGMLASSTTTNTNPGGNNTASSTSTTATTA